MSTLEIFANLFTAICIILAGRNSIHTWWTGLIGCVLFGALFFEAKLYADVTLQVFFFITGVIGWYGWMNRKQAAALPITSAEPQAFTAMLIIAALAALSYGSILHHFTDAYAPFVDSLVLTMSVVGQLLLVRRNVETWPVWIIVNVISVPLFYSRELYLTAGLYSIFLVNAVVSFFHWRKLQKAQVAA